MKSILYIIATFSAAAALTGCTTYVEPQVSPPTTTTTTVTRTTEDPYVPSVTTRKTTTTNY